MVVFRFGLDSVWIGFGLLYFCCSGWCFFVSVGEVVRIFLLLFCAICFLLEDVVAGIPLANFQKTVTTRVMTVYGWAAIPRQYQQDRGALVTVMTRLSFSHQKERAVLWPRMISSGFAEGMVIRSVLERLGLMSGQESGWTMIQWMSRQGRTFMPIVISSQTMAERACCMTEAQNE